MSKVWTKEELKNLSKEDFNKLSNQDRIEAMKQGKAFYNADKLNN